ncbi:sensor histidine kinase [Inhella proteolytica]|uniref:histidine kinase n=1 Tax=Inhella proteolytica TaxID=2795029 RepID=A0A931NJ92_9BURK|nr:sensor histidine kinase [Inhella proteolytica]MBH9578794.1 sensor histidine kinase [Inhella proteolytica]
MKASASLRRQLFLWLLLPQLVLWAAGALFTYKLAERYATEAVDASLLQATRALARQIKPLGTGLLIDLPRAAQDILEADPEDKLLYMVSSPPGQFILGNRKLPEPPQQARGTPGQPLVYDGELPASHEAPAQRLRVAALLLTVGEAGGATPMRVQVARSSANREELTRRLLLDTVLPLSVLMAGLSFLVWAGIQAGLAPIVRLRRAVEGRAPGDLRPIELETAPAELRSLALAINQLLDAVQRTVQAQRRFIADAAHQLRTPLAGLKSQTELALADASEPAQRERLQRVVEGATRSAHLVGQLLSLARAEPEAGSNQACEPLDLTRLARDTTAEWVPRALVAGVDLGMDDSGDPSAPAAWVRGHPTLLREALANLLDNALQYAGRGAEVTVRVQRAGDQVLLSVSDTGPGLPAHWHEKVLERFVRATHEGGGCGLGLAIVKEIAERHGGRVEVGGQAPQGLVVRLLLPAAPR